MLDRDALLALARAKRAEAEDNKNRLLQLRALLREAGDTPSLPALRALLLSLRALICEE